MNRLFIATLLALAPVVTSSPAAADDAPNVFAGAGLGVGLPGLGRYELFARAQDTKFLPNVLLEVQLASNKKSTQIVPNTSDAPNRQMVGSGMTSLVLKGGLIRRSDSSRDAFIDKPGTTRRSGGTTSWEGTIESVDGARSTGLVGGVSFDRQEWRPEAASGVEGTEEMGTTMTVIGGLHTDFSPERKKAISTGHELLATYGLNGQRKGIGALYRFEFAQYGFLYGGLELGWTFAGTQDNVPWFGLLRIGATMGVRFGFAQ